ncbi:MAG: hypothetical protein KatS3mg056_0996 [Chloroflexus sp.]|nr:MAG: hypothetical protein KatS3mg056_0996 [Chloroflexus sp.]
MYHALDREHGWRGSMAAARQTSRHVHDERERQSIQHVTARLERCAATGPCRRVGGRWRLTRGHAPGRHAHDSTA